MTVTLALCPPSSLLRERLRDLTTGQVTAAVSARRQPGSRQASWYCHEASEGWGQERSTAHRSL